MTTRLLLCCLALLFATGCVFSRKSGKARENRAISSEIEENFRKRWTDRRSAELVAQGSTPEAARQLAENEFRERYAFNSTAPQK